MSDVDPVESATSKQSVDSDQPHTPIETPSQQTADADLPWSLDSIDTDKNPFSEFSEEHLHKLDEVLASDEVRELLQQSGQHLNLLPMDLDTSVAGPSTSEGAVDDNLSESLVSAVFSDHGYAINPERAPKTPKPASVQKSATMTEEAPMEDDSLTNPVGLETYADPEASNEEPVMPTVQALLTAPIAESTQVDMDSEPRAESPYVASPRKSGRAPTRNRYLDSEWVTASPQRGRGRGRGSPTGDASAAYAQRMGRSSTRISDQKQRDLAEKIMQANRQAMEAERTGTDSSSPPSQKSGKGRGRGQVKDDDTTNVGERSSQEESDENNEDEENEEEGDEAKEEEEEESEVEDKKKAKTKKKKTKGKYEQDSDFSLDEDGKKSKKKKKGKKKGKKGKTDEESESDEGNKKKGKKKIELKKKKGKLKGKKKKGGKAQDGDSEGSDNEESVSPQKSTKKLKKKSGKTDVTETDSQKDDTDTDKQPLKGKKQKKLTKKERLKKLREAKEAKKAKLLEKKKLKKKDKKKEGDVDGESADASGKKKEGVKEEKAVKKKVANSDDVGPKKKKAKVEGASPKKGTAAKAAATHSPGKATKRKDQSGIAESPAKKAKQSKAAEKSASNKKKKEDSDSEDDIPLKKMITDAEQKKESSQQEDHSSRKEDEKSIQNIFSTLTSTLESPSGETKTVKIKPSEVVHAGINKKPDSKPVAGDIDNKSTDDKIDSTPSKIDSKQESLKRQDSRDSKDPKDNKHSSHHHHHHHSHHHHHHRHSSDSRRESMSEDRRDVKREGIGEKDKEKDRRHSSSSSSHSKDLKSKHGSRRDLKGVRETHESTSTLDKESHDKSKDGERRPSSGGKERRDSMGSVNPTTDKSGKLGAVVKKVGKDGKMVGKDGKKLKKSKKSDEMPVDATIIDLFKPDNLPAPKKEEVVEIKEPHKDTVKETDKVAVDTKESKVKVEGEAGKEVAEDKVKAAEKAVEDNKSVVSVKTGDEKSEDASKETDVKTETIEVVEEKVVDVKAEDVGKISPELVKAEEMDTDTVKAENSEAEKAMADAKISTESEHDTTKTQDKIDDKPTAAVDASVSVTNDLTKVQESPKVKEVQESARIKKPFQMSDFFREKRLKINDPKPKVKKMVKEEVAAVGSEEETSGSDTPQRRGRRNKAEALSEILKKEKLGSDDEEEEFEDDENDEDFEDPNKLYCICRQPHNQRFMICCDKCEEWFHGSCVGITRAQGDKMEKDNVDYICPQCKVKTVGDPLGDPLGDDTQEVVSSTDQGTVTASQKDPGQISDQRPSLFDKMSTTEDAKVVKPDSTVKTPTKVVVASGKADKPGKLATKPGVKPVTKKGTGDLSEKRQRVIAELKGESPKQQDRTMCSVCSIKPAKPGSFVCGAECQAQSSKQAVIPNIIRVNTGSKPGKTKVKEKHVAVVEKATGKTLTGDKAPKESEIEQWLKKHPTYEVLKPHKKPTPVVIVKTDEAVKETKSSGEKAETKEALPEGPEPIRLNVRKGLRDALAARADSAEDIMLSNSEVKGLALKIEEELYHYFKATDSKYKAKYRSLVFNIKDQKNKGLFRKILSRRIRPYKLVRMSAEELASKELAQWREQENKHSIEMIKQVETEAQKEQVQVLKKTHKGVVEVVEGEGDEDLSTLNSDEPKKPSTSGPTEAQSTVDLLAALLPDTTDAHGQHLFDANCKICTGKIVPSETTPTKLESVSKSSKDSEKEKKEEEEEERVKTKKERDLEAEEVVKEVLKAIQRAKADAKKEELESKLHSSVTVRSPDSALSSGLDKNAKFTPSGPKLWKGFIYMQDVSKFVTSAYRVTGPAEHLNLADTITVCGRINPEHVWDYLSKVKQAASRDICVIRFIPGTDDEKAAYISLYSYLNSRSRCGVVETSAKHIKDFYIVPLASHSKIPSVLKPFDGPGLEENRCHMLLGVIIRNKVKSSSSSSSSSKHSSSKSSHHHHHHSKSTHDKKPKSVLKDPNEDDSMDTSDKSSSTTSTPGTSSSTPRPDRKEKKKGITFDPIVKEYSHVPSEQDEPYIPGGADDSLDPNAPYDPEKEPLKPAPKKAAKSDAISKMIEKIAASKNPAEATAAMVAALAATPKLGNQRKLLMELTKKVDEQKRILEQKRISAKLSAEGKSPGGSSSPRPDLASKDPRLRAAAAAATATATMVASSEPMDVDMRVRPLTGQVSTTHSLSAVSAAATINKAHVNPSDPRLAHLSGAAQTQSTLPEADAAAPKGFYVDHPELIKETLVTAASTSKTEVVASGKKDPIATWEEPKIVDNETDESILSALQQELAEEEKKKAAVEADKERNDAGKGSETIVGNTEKSVEAASIVDQLKAEVEGPTKASKVATKETGASHVTSLLKDLTDKSKAGEKSSLPSALMSLFSKLPNSGDKEVKSTNEITKTEEVPQDVDLRARPMAVISEQPTQTVPTQAVVQTVEEDKPEKEKLSKSFLGFDYDSDSSSGSFEGFEDDGTKKLSPRKRKLVSEKKSPDLNEESDDVHNMDVDLRQSGIVLGGADDLDVDERVHSLTAMDVDHRQHSFTPMAALPPFMAPDQPLPPGEEWHSGLPAPHPPFATMPPPPISEWHPVPPELEPSPPPLPTEPPAPKPPEPQKKTKDKDPRTIGPDGSEKVAAGGDSGPLTSDQRIQEIVMQIASKEPIAPPPLPPPMRMGPSHYHHTVPLMHPMSVPGGMPMMGPPPIMNQNTTQMQIPPPLMPVCGPTPFGMVSSGWMGDPNLGPPPINAQSDIQPPPVAPNMQPGVGQPPQPLMSLMTTPPIAPPPLLPTPPQVQPTPPSLIPTTPNSSPGAEPSFSGSQVSGSGRSRSSPSHHRGHERRRSSEHRRQHGHRERDSRESRDSRSHSHHRERDRDRRHHKSRH